MENILIGYFNDNDYDISPYIRSLRPLRDATDAAGSMGGWTRVLEYCQSSVFRDALTEIDYLIIQIDTDRLFERPFELNLAQPVGSLIASVTGKFEDMMRVAFGAEFLENHSSRILFAIAVNEIECWLLPLYFADKNAGATSTCLRRLNQELSRQNERPITDKRYDQYDRLSRPFCKHKSLVEKSQLNPSFKIFMDRMRTVFPQN